jgi:hypothetical protein
MRVRHIKPGARTGIALPIIRVDGKDYDLSAMDKDGLLDLRVTVELAKGDVEGSIAAAKQELFDTGKAADPEWFRAANRSISVMNAQMSAIQNELGRRKEGGNINWLFVQVASEMLTTAVYRVIMDEAERRRDAKKERG